MGFPWLFTGLGAPAARARSLFLPSYFPCGCVCMHMFLAPFMPHSFPPTMLTEEKHTPGTLSPREQIAEPGV